MVVFIPGPISTPPKLILRLPSVLKVKIAPEDAFVGESEVFQKQLIPFALIIPFSCSILWPSCQLIKSCNLLIHLSKSPMLLLFKNTWVGEV